MPHHFRTGQRISWSWGSGHAHGKVIDRFERRVQRTIGSTRIVRRGTEENPAYLVETDDGSVR